MIVKLSILATQKLDYLKIMSSISEFERTKPVVTMKKINDLILLVEQEMVKTEILYKDRVRSLEDIIKQLVEVKNSLKKGE